MAAAGSLYFIFAARAAHQFVGIPVGIGSSQRRK
jgi:hypothetical protein